MNKVKKFERIVFVCGITTTKWMYNDIQKACKKDYPDKEVACVVRTYVYPQHKVICSMREELRELLSDGVPTVLVGHSFGGIIAVSLVQKYPELKKNIHKLITLSSPHGLDLPLITKAKEALGYQYEAIPDLDIITHEARQDFVVLPKFTDFPGSEHMSIKGTHEDYLHPQNMWAGDFLHIID